MTRLRNALPLFCAFTLFTCFAYSQTPAAPPAGTAPPAGQQPRAPRPAPTNLKALPKNTTGEQVSALMRQYEGDLGVGCDFCHATAGPDGVRPSRASDANPMKETARFMITMTADLNTQIDAMPNKMYADPVTCGTCHRGQKHPSVFVAPPQAPRAPAPPPPLH